MKKWNTTIRYAGFSLIGVALLMFISAFIAFRNGMDDSFNPLVFSGMVSLLSGFFAIITTKPQEKMTVEDGFRIVTGCWVTACVFGALPFLIYGGEFTVVNAFFESVSGFTTTGASILNNIEALPDGMQFWRIATAWMGGIGIVTLVSLVISGQHDRHSVLSSAELSDLTLVAIAILAVTANLYFSGYCATFPKALRLAAFQVCSLSTTTGFATADTNLWPIGSMGLLILCSLVCGCSGSTSGGMKMDRFVIVVKSLKGLVNSLIGFKNVNRTKLDGQLKTEENITSILAFMGTYMLIIAIGTVIFALSMDFKTSLTASIACIGSVGPGFGDVGSMGNYAGFLGFQKVVAMIIMLLGRVEIFPMLIAVKSIFSR